MTDRHYPCIHCGEPEYCMVYGCAAEHADKAEEEIHKRGSGGERGRWNERDSRGRARPAPARHATNPPKLIAPLIKAGTSERGCCAECGAPWVREVERGDWIGR